MFGFVLFVPLELYRVLCERRQGRDDQHPSRTANPESSAHNWPTAESVKKKQEKQEKNKLVTKDHTFRFLINGKKKKK